MSLESLRPRDIPWQGEVPESSVSADRYSLAYRKAFLEFVRAGLGPLYSASFATTK